MMKGLGGLGGLGDIGKMMKQAQEMQAKMAELQQKLETIEVEGSSGAGLVTAICTAKGALKSVTIDPSLMKPEEAEVAQDLVVAAVTDAQEKARERSAQEMQELTQGLPIPPGMFGQ
ncbi:MAG: YbaB/EbfC family nucleoid-associated protein [Pseudomonadota bacterium]